MTDISAMKINERLVRINEKDGKGLNVDSWLVLGKEKALVIDTLQESELLYDMVTSLTRLPIEVILTHGHPDHAGYGLHKFLKNNVPVYMNEKDKPILHGFSKEETDQILNLEEGMKFELGERELETVSCAGHTPGSMCLLDWENNEVFSGDAIGSGAFWMQLPESLTLKEFIPNLLSFKQSLIGMRDLVIYPGHIDGTNGKVDMQYIDDLIELCTGIVSGKLVSEEGEMSLGGMHLKFRKASFGQIEQILYKTN